MKKPTTTRKQNRGAVSHSNAVNVSIWLPKDMLAQIDNAVATLDTDRSKFLRRAIRNALQN